MDARDSISMLLAERQGMTGAQEQATKDVFKDYQAPYRGAPSQWDIHLDPSLQNQYGNATRPSPEWTGRRPSWANTTNLNGVDWYNQGANVLSPAAPQQYRQEQFGAQSGPYDPFGGAAGGGGQWLPQPSPYPPGGSSGAPGADGGVGLPSMPVDAGAGAPSPGAMQNRWGSNPGMFGGRMAGGGFGGGLQSLLSRYGAMPGSPSGFGGKATPGSQPSTLGPSTLGPSG